MASRKKDFDKDYIFNLIMPTGPSPVQDLEPTEPEDKTEDFPVQDSLSVLKDRISQVSSISAVQLHPAKELVLVNLMERLVIDRLDTAFDKFNCCRCDKCRRDVAAFALNLLPPRYVVAEPDELPRLLEECSSKEVSTALVKAILHIKNHPKH